MEITNSIKDIERYSIYANPAFLLSLKGVEKVGYFVEGAMFLPYAVIKNKFLKTLYFPVEILGEEDISKKKDFIDRVPQFAKSNLNVALIRTGNTAVFDCYPDRAKFCKFGSYIIDLSQSEEQLFSSFHSKHRNVVRKAQKDGVIIKHGIEYQKDVIKLMKDTYARQGMTTSLDNNFLLRLNELGDNVSYWIATNSQGEAQGSAIFLWSKGNSCYYLHGGSSQHTSTGAMNLLIWEAIVYMKEQGVKIFDFVGARVNPEPGSKLEGIQRFKERFGSTLKVGFAFEIIINKPLYVAYVSLLRIKCLLKGIKYPKSIVDQEIGRGNI